MTIGINATAAIKQPRTGVEEYTYQLIKHLTMLPEAREHRFLLYVPRIGSSPPQLRRGLRGGGVQEKNHHPTPTLPSSEGRGHNFFDFTLPPNFEIKILRWPLPFLWTQIRLAWEIWRRAPDVLFIPVHILPFFAPKNSVVTIHGLEYEYFPEHYPFWHRLYLKWSTRRAVKKASRIIAISANTKQDLIKFYGARAEKIEVVHHGVKFNPPTPLCVRGAEEWTICARGASAFTPLVRGGVKGVKKPYILYLGRIETKKNIQGILDAYKILKEKYKIPHELILAGAPGYGYENLKLVIRNLLEIRNLDLEIKELGYITEDMKWSLLSDASIFLFPSFYEGFGIPVLEAQSAGVPVITSYGSSLAEIAGEGALFVNPENSEQIAEAVKQMIDDKILRDRLIQSGFENVNTFNWEKCAKETLKLLK